MKKTIAFFVAFSISASVSNAQSTETPLELAERVFPTMRAYAYAEFIAHQCGSIRLKRGAKASIDRWLDKKIKEAGLTRSAVIAAVESPRFQKRAQDDIIAFIEKNDIIVSNRSTYCAAGERFIANKDPISHYLVKR